MMSHRKEQQEEAEKDLFNKKIRELQNEIAELEVRRDQGKVFRGTLKEADQEPEIESTTAALISDVSDHKALAGVSLLVGSITALIAWAKQLGATEAAKTMDMLLFKTTESGFGAAVMAAILLSIGFYSLWNMNKARRQVKNINRTKQWKNTMNDVLKDQYRKDKKEKITSSFLKKK